MREFEGRTALVAGGTSGIGRAVSEAFAKAGARVVIAARNPSRGVETVGAIERAGGEAWFVQTDVASVADTARMVERTLHFTHRLDVAVNAAAMTDPVLARLTEVPEEDFDDTLAATLKGVWACLRAELPVMVEQGHGAIVNIASLHGLAGAPLAAHYGAAKQGVIGLGRGAALEYAGDGVRINTVCPGPTNTSTIDRVFDAVNPNDPDQARRDCIARIPRGKIADPAEIADTVLWLCSDRARNLTGTVVTSDGGLSAGL